MKLGWEIAMSAALLLGLAGACDLTGGNASSDYDSCTASAQCIVRPASCCGTCGAATRGDAIGVNRDRVSAWIRDNCANTPCPACYMQQDPTLVAACVSKHCSSIDVLDDKATACDSSSDCRVRTSSCCECGGEIDRAHLIAISNEARFTSLVCEGAGACPECAPIYPSNVVARCIDHHCEARWLTE